MSVEDDIGPIQREAMRWDSLSQFECFQKIVVKKGGDATRPVANIHQQRLAEVAKIAHEMGVPCRIVGLKPRQKGSSTKSVHIGHCRLKAGKARGLIAGGAHFQTENMFEILGTYAEEDELDPGACRVTDKVARYKNGSRMQRITLASKAPGRSGTYQFLLITEAAYLAKEGVANADVVLDGLLKCVALEPDTIIIVETTANGACYDAETEVLTNQGWKLFAELDGTEAILTKDQETGVAYYQNEWKHQVHHHQGEMVTFQASNVSLRVTPNHSMWMAKQKGKMKMFRADSVRGKTSDYYFERKLGGWTADGLESIAIPAYRHRHGNGWREHPEKVVPIDVWLRFMGHFLTDGHMTWEKGNKRVALTQVKFQKEFRESANDLAKILGCKVREEPHENGIRLNLINAQLANYLKEYSQPKRIPRELLMGLSREQCRKFIDWMYEGDGCNNRRASARVNGSDYGRIYAGLDKEFSDDLQELFLKAGYGASERVKDGKQFIASFTHEDRACVKFNNPPIFEQECDEMVYCVTLPKDHLLMVRRRGQSVWCGNSGYFYDMYQKGITLEEFKAGKQGYVKIFSAWFEFEDSRLEPWRVGIYSEDDYTAAEVAYIKDLRTRLGVELDMEQVAWMRYAVTDECKDDWEKFKQDYPSDDETAFLTSGRCAFSAEGLAYQESLVLTNPRTFGIFQYNERADRVTFVQTDERQAMAVMWEKPRVGCEYILSVDTMTGADQTGGDDPDSHAAFVIRRGYLDTRGRWHDPAVVARNILVPGRKPGSMVCWWNIDVLEVEIWKMARYYQAIIAPEMNMDRGLVELLKLRGDVQIWMRRIFNKREQEEMDAYGWETTPKTRPMILEKLITAVRKAGTGEIGEGLEIRDPWAIKEAKNFGTKPSGKMEALVGHDDSILSLAIGIFLIEFATPYVEEVREEWLPPDLRGGGGGRKAARGTYS